jgi:Uma2 family endonuclease
MATSTRKLTYADFARFPADGFRHEIIEGEEFMTPAPNLDHQAVVGNVYRLIANHVISRKLGRVFVAPTDVILSQNDIVEPDVLYVSEKRASILTEKNVQGAPDLVIEVLSPSTAAEDRGPKLAAYERSGVGEYWLVDLPARTIEVREFTSPRRTRVYKEGQAFESTLLPGLRLQLSEIFAL